MTDDTGPTTVQADDPEFRPLAAAVQQALPQALAQAAELGLRPHEVVFVVIADDPETRAEAAVSLPQVRLRPCGPTVFTVALRDLVAEPNVVACLREQFGADVDLSPLPSACRVWFIARQQALGRVNYVDARYLGQA